MDWNVIVLGASMALIILNLVLLAIIGLMEIQKRNTERKEKALAKLEK